MKKPFRPLLAAGLAAVCLMTAGCQENISGWEHREDGVYYINSDGETVTGWLKLEDRHYYLEADGIMVTGWQNIDGADRYFHEDGSLATGWLELDDKLYYLRSDGTRAIGWLSLDGQNYFLREDGAITTGAAAIDGVVYLFNEDCLMTDGWVEVDGKRYYGNENCHPVEGWQEIEGKWYYFGEDLAAVTGWLEQDGFTYYFHDDGSAATGHVTIDGEEYTFARNGQLVILVNPWNYMPENYAPELVDIDHGHKIASIALADYEEMMASCRSAGLDPAVCSSYRTQEYQEKLYQNRIYRFIAQGYSEEEATALAGTIVAVPGTSEHQLGLALDIIDDDNWKLDESQAEMPTQQWLMEHSWEYGWILRYPNEKSEITGIIYEPWHYRYVGRDVAADIHNTGLCLEEYLEMLTEE